MNSDKPNDRSAYPDPHQISFDPYPVLNPFTSNDPEAITAEHGEPAVAPLVSTSQPSSTAQNYQNILQTLQARQRTSNDVSTWRFPGRDGVGYGAPSDTPHDWSFPRSTEASGDNEGDADDGVLGKPKENVFLRPMRDIDADATAAVATEIGLDAQMSDSDAPAVRGRDRGRGRGRPRSRGGRRGGWKQLLKGTTHDPDLNKDDPRRARGTGRRARGRARAEKNIDPGRKFKDHLQNANQAYFKGNYEEATEQAILAVQANPEVFQAHNLLSDCLEKLGRNQDAIAALLCGAHTVRDPKVWMLVGDRTMIHARESHTEEDTDQALFCYSTAVRMQPEFYEARVAKLELLIEKELWTKARLEAKALNRLKPLDIQNKKTYAELCIMTEDPSEILRAKDAYDLAWDAHYSTSDSFGDSFEQWSHLNIYLDLLDRLNNPVEAIAQLKRIARWFFGRRDEVFWDAITHNDCEFDNDQDRRGHVAEFQQGKASFDRSKYGDGLPLELRVKFGIFRLKMGPPHLDEALRHFNVVYILSDEIEEFYDVFLQVAESLRAHHQYAMAIQYYEPVLNVPEALEASVLVGLGSCYMSVQRYQEAVQSFKHALDLDATNVEINAALASAYEAIGDHQSALDVRRSLAKPTETSTGREERQTRPATTDEERTTSTREFAPIRPRPSVKKVTSTSRPRKIHTVALEARWRRAKEKEEESRRHFGEIKVLWPVINDDPDDMGSVRNWMASAAIMIRNFREMPAFYPKRDQYLKFRGFGRLETPANRMRRDMQALRGRLERETGNGTEDYGEEGDEGAPPKLGADVPQDYHSIAFNDWHHVFVDYALWAARLGMQQVSYDTVNGGLLKANVFYHDNDLHNTSLATALCIALMYNDTGWANDIARKFITSGDYRSGMSFQLTAGLARLCYGPNQYSLGPAQKFMLRMVKIQDGLAMTDEMRNTRDFGQLRRTIQTRLDKYRGSKFELDPGVLLLYGHQVSAANQSYSAIPYYLRALALQPKSACILLSLAVMHIQQAMKRQTENRQYGISTGLAFLAQYCEVRRVGGRVSDEQEVEFNVGRVWHALGLTTSAIPCYERVMDLSPKVRAECQDGGSLGEHEPEDFGMEAALALQNIYAAAGNEEAAMKITEEWLVM